MPSLTEDSGRAELSSLLDGTDVAAGRSLAAIVARSRQRSLQRLKIITGVSLVLALGGAGVAVLRNGTNASPSASNLFTSQVARSALPVKSPAWATHHRVLGTPPTGLKWATTSDANAGASTSSPSASLPTTGATLCTRNTCNEPIRNFANGPLTKLFTRSSGDITIRAFTENPATVSPGIQNASGASSSSTGGSQAPNSTAGNTGVITTPSAPALVCTTSQLLVVEVANSGAVGNVTVPLTSVANSQSSQGFDLVASSAVGVAEGTPMEVVTVHVGPNVNSVEASFADGRSDETQVVGGWAVLVNDGASPLPATIEALDSTGNEVTTASLNSDDAFAQPDECFIPVGAAPISGTASPGTTTGSK